jgi:hypothetical protein
MKLSRRALAAAVRPPLGAPPTGLQAESWRLLREELAADPEGAAEYERWAARRHGALPELRALVERFVAGEAGLEELRATLDRRSRREWDTLGLRGVSGAMFVNQLARRARDPAALEHALRAALRLPADEEGARAQLAALVASLAEIVGGGAHPGRVVFLVSVAWHAQDPAAWPGFHPSARQALALEEGLFAPSGDAVADYLAFRAAFLALARAIGIEADELEYLCWWHQRRASAGEHSAVARDAALHPELDEPDEPRPMPRVAPRRRARGRMAEYARVPERAVAARASEAPAPRYTVASPEPATEEAEPVDAAEPAPDHTHVQWVLATLGRRLGCRVWIAANDRAREWNGEPLGALSEDRMPPLGLDPASERLVRLIDVV